MDERTAAFYAAHAAEISDKHASVAGPVDRYLQLGLKPGMRVLDVGAGSGRDLHELLARGLDAYGVEPSAEMRAAAIRRYPELARRLLPGELPNLGYPFGGRFDAVLCVAVLMHLPEPALPQAARSLRGVLAPGGRLFVSTPLARPGLDAGHRDAGGRLFNPLPEGDLLALFSPLGLVRVTSWTSDDALGRPGHSWYTLVMEKPKSE